MNQRLMRRLMLFSVGLLALASATGPARAGSTPVLQPPVQATAPASTSPGVLALAFDPSGTVLASGGTDGMLRVWATATAQQAWAIRAQSGAPVTGVAVSSLGTSVASVGRDSVVRLWDLATGQNGKILRGTEHAIRAIAISSKGLIATGGEDSFVRLWDMARGTLVTALAGHRGFVNSVAFSPDGTMLASGGQDGHINLWNVTSRKLVRTLLGHSGSVTSVAFSPDGKTLASGSDDMTDRLWTVATGVQYHKFAGHTQTIKTVAFSPDGQTLADGSGDGTSILWDLASGKPRAILKGSPSAVTALSFSSDGTRVAGGGMDGVIRIWNPGSAQLLTTIQIPPVPTSPPTGQSTAMTTRAEQTGNLTKNPATKAPLKATGAVTTASATATNSPILVITSADPFTTYYTEMLRAEGINTFDTSDIAAVNGTSLAPYDVVVLPQLSLTPAQVAMLSDWVTAGGNLIAMRPDGQLAGLLGLTSTGTNLSDAYLLIDTTTGPGSGLVNQTIQFHGTADRYSPATAATIATLYTNTTTATANPAVTMRTVGTSGGHAAAFTYDLARSIVYTRQGNPAWAAQERDGLSPIRSDDLYFGGASPDWVDLNKVAIPQADEQLHLLTNLILQLNLAKRPLPRFWYLPRNLKAVVVMTGDDHANGGTAGRFDQYIASSPAGCNVANWECVRSTSYIYPGTPITDAQVQSYTAQGFEVGLHVNTNCADWTPTSLDGFYTQQLTALQAQFPHMPAPTTHRTHCIAWSDWGTQPKVELNHGMHLDTTYYYWPGSWINNRPGFMTGSALPMRFADSDGTLMDVYQANTELTDESNQTYPFNINALLDSALGTTGYYGVFVVNAHTDIAASSVSDAVIASAQARNVPVISARQLLDWVNGRTSSGFGAVSWGGTTLSFTITPGAGANGLQAMIPATSTAGQVSSITVGGAPVTYITEVIKGVSYAVFPALAGSYSASYAPDTTPPTVTATAPTANASSVPISTSVSAIFSEAVDPTTVTGATVSLVDPSNAVVAGTVSYDSPTRAAILKPSSSLQFSTTYTAIVKGGAAGIKDLAGNALVADDTWSFSTAAAPACPCSIWTASATPTNASANDPNAVELGVKFRADLDGYITGIRFYKGSANTGTHIGNLWSTSGQKLATATFSGETATGWQQVTFATPVHITANTTYIASYHSDVGNYAFDFFTFAGTGVANAPLQALQDNADGPNGVYLYSATSGFPTQTYQSTNYWVDVVFTTSVAPDTTPPTVTSTSPTSGATAVSTATTVKATFSEAIDTSTLSTSSFSLKDGSNTLVAATISYDAANRIATLTPSSALTTATTYTAIVKGGAAGIKDLAGNALVADDTWSFTTAAPGSCPCTIWAPTATPTAPSANDPNAAELGVKFRADLDGYITGIRFYKGSGNTGTHTGNLWSTSGQKLATATFSGETATGWQQVTFATPVQITANTTYVASYHTDTGNFAEDDSFFATAGVDNAPLHALKTGVSGGNGVYIYGASAFPTQTFQAANYWVDVVFTTSVAPDTTPPTVTSTSPTSGATTVSTATTVKATFSEAIDTSTLSTSSFSLKDGSNTLVAATISYDAANRIATLTPSSALTTATTYTAIVKGGAAGIKDLAGNALVADDTWSFTTAAPGSCPCTIWAPTATPTTPSSTDGNASELGVKFRSDVSGFITGIRFYKGSGNSSTHVGTLWSTSGQKLATATFSGETATGWQQVTFATPVPITANTTYVASYHTNAGHFAEDDSFFATAGVDNAALHALQNGVDGANGVYIYSAITAFPTQTFQSANYWVDVVFTTSSAAGPPPAAPTGLAATASATGSAFTWAANTENNLAGYNVYRSSSASGPFTRLNPIWITSPSYEDTLAPNGTSYYEVTAGNTAGNESAPSAMVNSAIATTNLLVNPGFELDANNDTRPDNWTSNTAVVRSSEVVRSGTFAMRHFSTANNGYTISQTVATVVAGTTYTFVGWVNIPATSDVFTFSPKIVWRNASNTILRTDTIKTYSAATNGWDKATAALAAPTGATNAVVQMVVTSLNATIYADDFALR